MDHNHIKTIGNLVRDYVLDFTDELGIHWVTPDMCGACAIASKIVYETIKLKFNNVVFYMCENDFGGHCWTRLGNTVIDATATQFDVEERVLIESFSKYKRREFYAGKVYTDQKALAMIKAGWPDYQCPDNFQSEIRDFVNMMKNKMDIWYPSIKTWERTTSPSYLSTGS